MSGRRGSGSRVLAVGALALGLGTATSCSAELAAPTPPSPGLLTSQAAVAVQPPPTAEGPGQTAPGIHLRAVPRGDGSFDVTEDILLRSATSIVQLRPPESGERLQGMMIPTAPKATNLRMVADDEQVSLDQTDVTKARDLPLVDVSHQTQADLSPDRFECRRMHSKARRASAAISPLAADTDDTLPTNLAVSGGGLLNVVCPRLKRDPLRGRRTTRTRDPAGNPGGPGARSTATEPSDAALIGRQRDTDARRPLAVRHGRRTA